MKTLNLFFFFLLFSQSKPTFYSTFFSISFPISHIFFLVFCSNNEQILPIQVLFGTNIPQPVQTRIQTLLSSIPSIKVTLEGGNYTLSFGNTSVTRYLIAQSELDALGSEGFIVRSKDNFLVTDGNSLQPNVFQSDKNIGKKIRKKI